MGKTVRFYTLGCKVNQYDSEAMLEQFLENGYKIAEKGKPADVCVINTCMVTGTGEQKSMQAIRRLQRQNPGTAIVIAGCLAQRKGEELRDTGANVILGVQRRKEIVPLLAQALESNSQIVAVESLDSIPFESLSVSGHQGKTRALMKIQEGCDNHCTFCIVPTVRGNIRSRSLNEIRAEANALAKAGYREVVLTGVHLTSYGRDLEDKPSLADAIRTVAEAEGIERIRLGSLEPVVANETFIHEIQQIPKLCPQFHLALQSGSDETLRRMKRRYNTEQFRNAAQRIKAAFPDAALTTDVIVGFPGETEEAFLETVAFCKTIGFMRIHVFPYSPREGTPAASMPDQVGKSVKEDRVHRLSSIADELSVQYRKQFLDTKQPVLIETRCKSGWIGYTPQYISVLCPSGHMGQTVTVRLTELTKEGLRGEPVE